MDELSAQTSRRSFARWIGAGAALAALRPLSVAVAAAPAADPLPGSAAEGIVRLSANENPYGPPAAALAAMRDAMAHACRYPDERDESLRGALGKHLGVKPDTLVLGDGSSQILHAAAAAFAGPGGRVVTADPTFEALGRYATVRGATVQRVALAAEYRHDLPAMRAALGADARGLIYICNPNNPTATLTPAADLETFLEALPIGITALVDEAYHHYADGRPGYASMVPVALSRPNVIVARTFSKIYGMAGLRCGYAVAAPATIAKLREQIPWDSSNLMALAAAQAALGARDHVEIARRRNDEVRTWTTAELAKAGVKVVPSSANFFMAEIGRDVAPLIAALKEQGIEVGRRFPALPTHLRVTVGTENEMQRFVAAFNRVSQRAAA